MCEHKYQVIDSEVTTFYSATFYCERCLDIQHREKWIDTGVVEVKKSE